MRAFLWHNAGQSKYLCGEIQHLLDAPLFRNVMNTPAEPSKYNTMRLLNILLLLWPALLHGQSLEIWQLQGSSTVSPYYGQQVSTSQNVVTGVGNGFFFIQTPDQRSDNNSATSDGIMVVTSQTPNLQPGMLVNVSGLVDEQNGMTLLTNPGLNINIVGQSDGLPTAIPLTGAFPTGAPGTTTQLERVEGMRVSFTAPVCGPSGNNELAALAIPSRPFREPGIIFPGQIGLPIWDGNPEVFWFRPEGLGAAPNRFLNVGQTITASAIFTQEGSRYIAMPITYSLSGSALVRPVRAPLTGELTIGSINVELLFSTDEDYIPRLRKLAKYITESLQSPDILAIQEIGGMAELSTLNFYITQATPSISYTPYLIQGDGDLQLGFLVGSKLQGAQVTQLGAADFLSIGGRMHDRPPLLLEAILPTSPPTPIKVLNIHMRSLIGIEGSTATFVRIKRHEQAIGVAQMIQQRQGENFVVVGDYNAFQFSDGYVDVLAQLTGQPSLGAQYPPVSVVSPPLENHSATQADVQERYSYVFNGSAQILDHCLSTDMPGFHINGLQYARGNADAAVAYQPNQFIVQRVSDHDGFVLFLQPNLPLSSRDRVGYARSLRYANPLPPSSSIEILAPSAQPLSLALSGADGRLHWQELLPAGAANITLPPYLPSGLYYLSIVSAEGQSVHKVVLP